jgi:Ni/Co efflux regulator RcnB
MRNMMTLTLAAAFLGSALAPAMASAQEARGGHEQAQERRDDHRDERREERRDDWRAYRDTHGEVFRGGAYAAPRGQAYRPIAQGERFAPEFYQRRYWVANPARYHLPPAGPHQRWVRYGHDMVRVDIGSGRALEVYGSFFL